MPDVWFDRYGRVVEEYCLPKGIAARQEYAEMIGTDGMQLLIAVQAETTIDGLAHLPAVEILRQTWVHQYYMTH